MGKVDRYPPGTFCWVDLGTTDPAGAKAFYGGVFGWTFQDVPPDDPMYVIARLGEDDVTGIHSHTQAEGTGWSSSVSVDDVDASVSRAESLGGTVTVPPADLPGTARVAAIRDPGGAELVFWQPAGFIGARVVNEPGAWTWNELTTPDLSSAREFYEGLFGWQTRDAPGGGRAAFALGDLLVGGVHEPMSPEDSVRWTVAFWVEDVDASAAAVERLGGRTLLPPMDIPVGRFAIVSDPAGATFTITAVPGGPVGSVAS